jgi:MFS family permease
MALGFDVFTSGTAWSLFTGISIIGISANNEIYAANGILLSVILFAALAASYAYGKLIDRRRGGELLRISAVANSLVHFSRAFIVSPIGVAGLNVANEAATTGYTMAYTRGIFDNADLSGRRVTYLGMVEILSNLGAALGAVCLGLLVMWAGDVIGMQRLFFVAGVVLLLVATARFSLYRK